MCRGGVKSYFVEKKMPNGKPKRKVIGKHGLYTLEQARTLAKDRLIGMDKGIDPVDEKRKLKQKTKDFDEQNKLIPTLLETFQLYKSHRKLSDASVKAYTRCIDEYFSDWKELKVSELTEKMIIDRHKKLSESSAGEAQANLSMKFLSAIFNFAKNLQGQDSHNLLTNLENPVLALYRLKLWNKVKRRKNYVRREQQSDWSYAVATTTWISEQNNDFRAYTNQDYLLTLALTGFRREEGESLEWSNIDLKYGTLKITNTKNGVDLLLALGETLLHIFKQRKKYSNGSKYVFPTTNNQNHIKDHRHVRHKITETQEYPSPFMI